MKGILTNTSNWSRHTALCYGRLGGGDLHVTHVGLAAAVVGVRNQTALRGQVLEVMAAAHANVVASVNVTKYEAR